MIDGDEERDRCRRRRPSRCTPTEAVGRCREHDRDDRSRRRRAAQARVEEHVGEQRRSRHRAIAAMTQDRLRQHVREVDLVDSADELDEDRTGSAWHAAGRHRRPRTRAGCRRRGRGSPRSGTGSTCRSAAAWIVPSGVKTPWLIALFRNRILPGSTNRLASGSRSCVDQEVDHALETVAQSGDRRGDQEEADDRERGTDDAAREVVDQHLEPGPDLAVPDAVDLLHDPRGTAGRRSWRRGTSGCPSADDDTHGRDDADDAAAQAVDHAATRCSR